MPRHDRAYGVYHSSRQSGAKRVHIGRGHGRRNDPNNPNDLNDLNDLNDRNEVNDMPRQGGNTPKPNAPKPQQPKPTPRPGK